MTVVDWVIDGALACALPFLAWRVRATDHLPKGVVLFIAFGLLSAVAWARLHAPDIALVEAAVGAGLTGALLMSALGWGKLEDAPKTEPGRLPFRLFFLAITGAIALMLGWGLWTMPPVEAGLAGQVADELSASGVSHPVTAVLLNFRGYDTLLEILVLLTAALAAQAQHRFGRGPEDLSAREPKFALLARMLVPGVVVVGGYLLWQGSHAPGGAFQAGVLVAGGGILLTLTGLAPPPSMATPTTRILLVFGPVVFVGVAVGPLISGAGLLEYPEGWAKTLIVSVESALAVSMALTLVMFFPREALRE